MPIIPCPNCKKGIDFDGFIEHGVPTLFYCDCGKIYEPGPNFGNLTEIPSDKVDLSGLEGKFPIRKDYYRPEANMSQGLFINKGRLKEVSDCL